MTIRSLIVAAAVAAAVPLFMTVPVTANAQAPAAKDWRQVKPDNLLVIETSKGRVLVELFPEFAPAHVAQIKDLASKGLYDGTRFHRVIDDFMAQGGDIESDNGAKLSGAVPTIKGEFFIRRGADMKLDLIGPAEAATTGYYKGLPVATQVEFLRGMTADGKLETWGLHCQGVTSMARTNDPNSANTQFFLMRGTASWLDKSYSIWGRILSGQDAVMALRTGEPVRMPDTVVRMQLASDMPAKQRPSAYVKRMDTPAAKAELDAAYKAGQTNPCDRPAVPSLIVEPQ
jgi:peptidylprolyl isomerase